MFIEFEQGFAPSPCFNIHKKVADVIDPLDILAE
jgi:hypothetical protein